MPPPASRVNTAVAADPSLLAAATVAGTPGDNTGARALANLRDARPLNGGTTTFTDFWTELVYEVGQDRSLARAEQTTRGEVVRQIENLRDSVSGVSLDEEAAGMMRFQRAYEANARFFTVINDTLDALLSMGRLIGASSCASPSARSSATACSTSTVPPRRPRARQREVSSGKRIEAASDNPSAMSTTIAEKAEMSTIDHYLKATDSVESRLTVVDTVMSDIIGQITNGAVAGRRRPQLDSHPDPARRHRRRDSPGARGHRHRGQHPVPRHVPVLGRPVVDATVRQPARRSRPTRATRT